MSAVLPTAAAPAAERSEGVWHAAWRRFKADRVGLYASFVVLFFALLIVLSATGLGFVATLLVALLTIHLIIGAVWAPNTRGKSLRQIEVERYGVPVSDAATVPHAPSTVDIPAQSADTTGARLTV